MNDRNMSIGDDSLSSSQALSSSHVSLNHSKKASTEISKIYKHASQLYLTRQLAEAYEVLQPVVKPAVKASSENGDDHTPAAPISTAATSQRIKIWSLYVTLLNAVVDLGPEEGRRDFGSKEYSSIVRTVQSGDIWEQVVQNGYQGREGSVDAEVVYNLSNLLLVQAQSQEINQSRLETYLSSSSGVGLDFSAHLEQRFGGQTNGHRPQMSGAATPKDLSSRIKLLELFTLHVLPRNQEWDYAKSFINNSDILDEERREAFLQTLQELQDAHDRPAATDTEDEFGHDYVENSSNNREEQSRRTSEYALNGTSTRSSEQPPSSHRRSSSEVDYGIDYGHPNESNAAKEPASRSNDHTTPAPMTDLPPTPVSEPTKSNSVTSPSSSKQSARSKVNNVPPPPSLRRQNHKNSKSSSKPKANASSSSNKSNNNTLLRQAQHILYLIGSIPSNLTQTLAKNPTALLRMLMFMVAFLVMLSRRNIRERVRAIVERSWGKMKGTVGMGVKVSYV